MEEIGCSQATLYRLIANLRDHLGAPIEQDPDGRGFFYEDYGMRPFELPGIWLSPEELQALISARDVLGRVQPGLLDTELHALQDRIANLLDEKGIDADAQTERVRIIHQASRLVDAATFQPVLHALVQRKRLHIGYHARGSDEVTDRTVSPQRLTSYRNNWYLDGYCHLREGLRSFALERIQTITSLDESAEDIDAQQLSQHFTSAYGIFSGKATHMAVLKFSPKMARWVAEELWHSKQEGQWLADGCYELRIPYGHSEELLMDILRFGPEVEVLEPDSLRAQIKEQLVAAGRIYGNSQSATESGVAKSTKS